MPIHSNALTLLLALLSAACNRSTDPSPPAADVAVAATDEAAATSSAEASSQSRTIERTDGCKIEILAEGGGRALARGDEAILHCTGRVAGQEQSIVSTAGWHEPLHVRVGARSDGVVAGLACGLEGLAVGTRARIEVPPALGYGDRGAPAAGVPADATLVFEVEVLGAR